MNPAHLHLALNHLPIVVTIVGVALLGVAAARGRLALAQTALAVLVAAAVTVVPVYLSGGQAEDVVEDRPGISEHRIEEHEEAGEFAAIALGLLGAFAAGALFALRTATVLPRWVGVAGLAAGLLVTAILLRTANLGGEISHPEIRGDEAAADAAR